MKKAFVPPLKGGVEEKRAGGGGDPARTVTRPDPWVIAEVGAPTSVLALGGVTVLGVREGLTLALWFGLMGLALREATVARSIALAEEGMVAAAEEVV
jgi:hypothetical protein